jgi:DNA-binding transcriptional regulator LsrR (DeoR family)
VYDYTEAEIVRKTGLTPKTVSKELENLRNEDIVKITRKIGRSNMYSLTQSIEVKGLIQYKDDIIKSVSSTRSK